MPALTKAQRGAQTRLQHGTPLFQKRPYDSNQENINPQSTPVSAVRNGIPKGSRELAELHDTANQFISTPVPRVPQTTTQVSPWTPTAAGTDEEQVCQSCSDIVFQHNGPVCLVL